MITVTTPYDNFEKEKHSSKKKKSKLKKVLNKLKKKKKQAERLPGK